MKGITNFINILHLVKNKKISFRDKSIFVGKTKKSYLLGPLINNKSCTACLKKRILSSSFFEIKNYLLLTKQDKNKINNIFIRNNINLSGRIVEYDYKHKKTLPQIHIHEIQPIPGCNNCQNNK